MTVFCLFLTGLYFEDGDSLIENGSSLAIVVNNRDGKPRFKLPTEHAISGTSDIV